MKKSTFVQIIFCTFAISTSLSSYAGATNSDSNATTNSTSTAGVSPASDSDNMSTNGSTHISDSTDGEDHDYGWIGLIGLVGLAGLVKKNRVENRVDTTRVPNR